MPGLLTSAHFPREIPLLLPRLPPVLPLLIFQLSTAMLNQLLPDHQHQLFPSGHRDVR